MTSRTPRLPVGVGVQVEKLENPKIVSSLKINPG